MTSRSKTKRKGTVGLPLLTSKQALDRMRTGSRLVHMHETKHWFVVPGGAVAEEAATAIRNDPRVIGQKDGLFPDHNQTWRMQTFV
jgi:hypothetical protein